MCNKILNIYTSHTMLFMCLRRLLHLHKNIEFSIPHIPYIFCCLYGSGDFHMLTIHWIFILHKPCYFCVIWDFPMFTKDWISIIHIPCCLVVWDSLHVHKKCWIFMPSHTLLFYYHGHKNIESSSCTSLAVYVSQETFTCAQKNCIFIPLIPCCLCVMGDFDMCTKILNIYTSHTLLFMCHGRLLHGHKILTLYTSRTLLCMCHGRLLYVNNYIKSPYVIYLAVLVSQDTFFMYTKILTLYTSHTLLFMCHGSISYVHKNIESPYVIYLAVYVSWNKTCICTHKYWISIPHIPCCLCVIGHFYMYTKILKISIFHIPCCLCFMGDFHM